MVAAQVLQATHAVDDKVGRVEDKVLDKVAGVDERVASVGDHVKAIDDKVAAAIDGALPSLIGQPQNILTLVRLERKETKVVIQQVADDMDQVKSLSFSFCVDIRVQAKPSLQGISYDRIFADGSLPRIPQLTTTLPAAPIASKQLTGFSKEVSSPNGNPMAHFCGSTENVRSPDLSRADGR